MPDTTSDSTPNNSLGYIRPQIPEFKVPPFAGQHYEAMVPDTLDLADRARLAIHAMTENPNPAADYEPFWQVSFVPKPLMSQNYDAPSIMAKFQESVCLARIMCGSEQNLHVDRCWMEATLKKQGSDGLLYMPVRGRPWAYRMNSRNYARGARVDKRKTQILYPYMNGQLLRTMSLYALRDQGSVWTECIRGVVDGLTKLVVHAGKYAYPWPGPLYAEKEHPPDVQPQFHCHLMGMGMITFGLLDAYRHTAYEPALALAGKFIAFEKDVLFTPEAEFLTPMPGARKAHVHEMARIVHGMMIFALLTNNPDLLAFAVKNYEWARTRMDVLTGYTPNLIPCPQWRRQKIRGVMDTARIDDYVTESRNGCEVAGLTDMIGLALWLSETGLGDYWDDVDRWVRNMLAESQMLDTQWIHHLPGSADVSRKLPPWQTYDRVAERNLGSWPTGAWPNGWFDDDSPSSFAFVHGDTPTATRALYWVWHRILKYSGDKLAVNLLLNRASKWADVDSYLPYEGRVDIKIKQSVSLSVRIPEWVSPNDVRVQVNATDRNPVWHGRYAGIGTVGPQDTATLTFPIGERIDKVWIEKKQYTLARRGNNVVSIYPHGRYYPFYQGGHFRSGKTQW